jgi:hypothetical protein
MAEAAKPSKLNPLLARKVYVGERISALRDELKSLTAERSSVLEKLRSGAKLEKKVESGLKQRKIYLDQRPKYIREEIKELMAERAAIIDKLKA